ncbi:MAG: hypothetical protein H7317_08690 [Pseudorhodobacter sp.]|nr:hypothetical protein [Pseudorhodobacter sp.]
MIKDISVTLKRFVGLFRQGTSLTWTIMLPLLVVAVSWPLLQVWLQDERATFMVAFVLAMGTRLMLRSDGLIRKMRGQISNRSTVIVALLFGPGVIAFLIWVGEPVWCQRFLSLYFLVMATLYLLDVIDGRHAMVRYYLPFRRNRGADGLMARVMAIFYMTLLLLNETMIAQSSLTVWLVYFGLLPMLSHRVLLALVRTVDEAYAKGYGRG